MPMPTTRPQAPTTPARPSAEGADAAGPPRPVAPKPAGRGLRTEDVLRVAARFGAVTTAQIAAALAQEARTTEAAGHPAPGPVPATMALSHLRRVDARCRELERAGLLALTTIPVPTGVLRTHERHEYRARPMAEWPPRERFDEDLIENEADLDESPAPPKRTPEEERQRAIRFRRRYWRGECERAAAAMPAGEWVDDVTLARTLFPWVRRGAQRALPAPALGGRGGARGARARGARRRRGRPRDRGRAPRPAGRGAGNGARGGGAEGAAEPERPPDPAPPVVGRGARCGSPPRAPRGGGSRGSRGTPGCGRRAAGARTCGTGGARSTT
jgi:hypothetical protein